jgi:hypothetical protein
MHPQQIIIVVCACLAMMFSVVSRRLIGNGRRWTLLLAAFGLFAVAGYESYMSVVLGENSKRSDQARHLRDRFSPYVDIDNCRRARLV